jgi:hypothetical protein
VGCSPGVLYIVGCSAGMLYIVGSSSAGVLTPAEHANHYTTEMQSLLKMKSKKKIKKNWGVL